MQPAATELEQIVRVVLERLAAGRELMAGVAEIADVPREPTELTIDDRVITTHLVEGRLDGKRTLRVGSQSIVTPAVVDLLRAKQIELVRGSRSSQSAGRHAFPRSGQLSAAPFPASKPSAPEAASSTNPSAATVAPILVCGSAVWFNSLNRHLCPKQALVQACDEPAVLPLVASHLASGGRRAIWLSSRPFAAAAAAGRGAGSAVAVQLPSLAELPAALEQAQPQLLIVDAPRWTVAAIGNLVRSLARTQ